MSERISVKEAARRRKCSPNAVRKALVRLGIARDEAGGIDAEELDRLWPRKAGAPEEEPGEEPASAPGTVSYAEAKRRKELALAQLRELEVAQAEGSLIPLDVHEKRVAALCDRLRAVLSNLPSKYLGRIQQAQSDAEAHAVGEAIRDETFRALLDVADEMEGEGGDDGTPAAA